MLHREIIDGMQRQQKIEAAKELIATIQQAKESIRLLSTFAELKITDPFQTSDNNKKFDTTTLQERIQKMSNEGIQEFARDLEVILKEVTSLRGEIIRLQSSYHNELITAIGKLKEYPLVKNMLQLQKKIDAPAPLQKKTDTPAPQMDTPLEADRMLQKVCRGLIADMDLVKTGQKPVTLTQADLAELGDKAIELRDTIETYTKALQADKSLRSASTLFKTAPAQRLLKIQETLPLFHQKESRLKIRALSQDEAEQKAAKKILNLLDKKLNFNEVRPELVEKYKKLQSRLTEARKSLTIDGPKSLKEAQALMENIFKLVLSDSFFLTTKKTGKKGELEGQGQRNKIFKKLEKLLNNAAKELDAQLQVQQNPLFKSFLRLSFFKRKAQEQEPKATTSTEKAELPPLKNTRSA